jgi:hypothetical protein
LKRLDLSGGPNEAVTQQVPRRRPELAVLDKALRNEVLEVFAKVTLQLGRWVLGDLEEDLHGVDVTQRRLAIGHLHSCDAQGPDISLEAVTVLLNDLRGHPKGGSDKGVSLGLDVGQLSGNAKVSQLDFARFREKDIGGLDVAVNLALVMQVLDAQQEFAADDGDMSLGEVGGFQLRRLLVRV